MISDKCLSKVKDTIINNVAKARYICEGESHDAEFNFKVSKDDHIEFIFMIKQSDSPNKICNELQLIDNEGQVCSKKSVNIGRGTYDLFCVYKLGIRNVEA